MLAKGESSLPLSSIAAATLLAERPLCASAFRCDLKTQKKEICWERRSYFHLEVTKKALVTTAALQTEAPYCLQRHPWQPFLAAWI